MWHKLFDRCADARNNLMNNYQIGGSSSSSSSSAEVFEISVPDRHEGPATGTGTATDQNQMKIFDPYLQLHPEFSII